VRPVPSDVRRRRRVTAARRRYDLPHRRETREEVKAGNNNARPTIDRAKVPRGPGLLSLASALRFVARFIMNSSPTVIMVEKEQDTLRQRQTGGKG
jgi:hypothetical protein